MSGSFATCAVKHWWRGGEGEGREAACRCGREQRAERGGEEEGKRFAASVAAAEWCTTGCKRDGNPIFYLLIVPLFLFRLVAEGMDCCCVAAAAACVAS